MADDCLVFEPNVVDRRVGSRPLSVPNSMIAGIGIERPSASGLFSGGARRRLRVVTTDGGVHLFVINELDQRIAELREFFRLA